MKTKIIYISGNEVFEMSEIRAAFEEVRKTLGLENDTVLFGVPVDADTALAQPETKTMPINDTEIDNVPEIIVPNIEIESPAPVIESLQTEQNMEIPEVEEFIDTTEEPALEPKEEINEPTADDTVIPILSVLGGTPVQEQPDIEEEQQLETPEPQTNIDTEVDTESEPEILAEEAEFETLKISIEDVVTDQVPAEEKEKTLEDLLESMKPLGEDTLIDTQPEQITEQDSVDADDDFSVSMTDDMTDTDATLAQLANEFAQTQDKIPDTPKTSGNGKISKLKNILPFKKAKRDDTGLMGDLFGWAGIAANDEDFSMPGFFK